MVRLFSIVCVFCLFACSSEPVSTVEETDERQFRLAKDFQSQGRYEDALITYLGLIAYRHDSPESHLEVGYIYLQTLKDPVRSIYHFDRYLELKPESERVPQVKQLIETAKLAFLRQLPTKPFQGDLDRLELLEIIADLRDENSALKQKYNRARNDLASLQASSNRNESGVLSDYAEASSPLNSSRSMLGSSNFGVNPANQTTGAQLEDPPINPRLVPKSYVVKSGDTLSKISKQFYGTENRWNDIYQANRDRLSSARSLRVGQELLIP